MLLEANPSIPLNKTSAGKVSNKNLSITPLAIQLTPFTKEMKRGMPFRFFDRLEDQFRSGTDKENARIA
jgi:hypothetical protein